MALGNGCTSTFRFPLTCCFITCLFAGPAYWKDDYPDCGKPFQSPIDINTTNTVENEEFTHFVFENYDKVDAKLTVQNNGHTGILFY